MATIKTNTNNTYYAVLTLTESSYSVENNSSDVDYSLVLYNGIQSFSGYTIGYEIIINGSRVAYQDNTGNQTSMSANSSKTIATGVSTITHNSDGSKTISASVRIWTNSASYLPVSLSGSGSMALTTIPRASVPTCSNFNAGSAVTITTNRKSSTFTHILKYTLNGTTKKIAEGVGASYSWTADKTKELASLIPNATSASIKITCITFASGKEIGSKSVTVKITVPDTADFQPSVSRVEITDTKDYATKYGDYVQGKSVPKATITATAGYSTIKSYKVKFQGVTKSSTSNEITLATASKTGSQSIVVTVTDGRGRTASKTVTITVLAYAAPSVSAKVVRCNSSGTANNDGAYMKVTCTAKVIALNNVNSKTIKLQYKKKSATTWTTNKTWTAYTVSESVVIAADIDSSYDIQLVATDDFATSTYGTELGTVAVILDFNASGKGMAIGKVSEGDGLEVDWDSTFNKPITLKENFKFDSGTKVSTPIYIWGGNEDGTGIAIGAGGTVVIGGGESARNFVTNMELSGTAEQTYITSDGSIYFYTNCNTIADKKLAMYINTSGQLALQEATYMQNNKGLHMMDSGGTYRDLFRINASDVFAIGYGMYSADIGQTNLYGNSLYLYAKTEIHAKQHMIFDNNKSIYHYTSSGALSRTLLLDSSNQLVVGYDQKASSLGSTYIDGNLLYLRSNGAIYANGSTISTSDEREKENIVPLGASPVATYGMRRSVEQVDIHSELFDRLKPVQFNYINRTEARTCFGLIAQDVLAALEELGFAEDELDLVYGGAGENTDRYGISYQNFTALLIHEVQKLKAQVAALERN